MVGVSLPVISWLPLQPTWAAHTTEPARPVLRVRRTGAVAPENDTCLRMSRGPNGGRVPSSHTRVPSFPAHLEGVTCLIDGVTLIALHCIAGQSW